jgi:glycosyltransferase involved in cell wall biosynthesis
VVWVSHDATVVGGAQRSLLELVGRLADRGNLELLVVVPDVGPLSRAIEERGIGLGVVTLPRWTIVGRRRRGRLVAATRWVLAVRPAWRLLRSLRPDVVVTNTVTTPSVAVAARLLGRPHVWVVRELLGVHPHGLSLALPRSLAATLMGRTSTCVVANSPTCAASLSTWVRHAPIEVIEPGCVIPVRAEARPVRDAHTPLRVLHLGRLSAEKGVPTIIRAVGEAARRGVDAHLRLVGQTTPAFRRRIESLVTDEGLGDRVSVDPPTDSIVAVLDATDVVVVACPFESFGRVTVEAMRRGAVVIGADTGATVELIEHGRTGLCFEAASERAVPSLADAIQRVADDPALGAQLGAGALIASGTHFDPDTEASRVEALVTACVEQCRRPAG